MQYVPFSHGQAGKPKESLIEIHQNLLSTHARIEEIVHDMQLLTIIYKRTF